MDCTNCFIKGGFKLTGSVKVKEFQIQELIFGIAPSGVRGNFLVNTKASADFTTDELKDLQGINSGKKFKPSLVNLSHKMNIIQFAIPGASFKVTSLFSFGFSVILEAGFDVNFGGDLQFTTGLNISFPDDARITLNTTDLKISKATGFSNVIVQPIFDIIKASGTVDGRIWLAPKLALDVDLPSVGKLSAAVKVSVPEITANAAVEYNDDGVCPNSKEKTGLSYTVKGISEITVDITSITASFLGIKDAEKSNATVTLASFPLFKQSGCVPMVIPRPSKKQKLDGATPIAASKRAFIPRGKDMPKLA
jgi:hypothetical protein